VAAHFSQPPTLGEIIEQATRYGFTRHTIRVPGSRARFVYLRRVRGTALELIDLPPSKQSERLTWAVAEGLCRKLGIPPEDFGLGSSA